MHLPRYIENICNKGKEENEIEFAKNVKLPHRIGKNRRGKKTRTITPNCIEIKIITCANIEELDKEREEQNKKY